jgi:hypothetical protein
MSLCRSFVCAGLLAGLTATAAVAQQPAALAGTLWFGSEELQGFGALAFKFGPQGKVTMTDTSGDSEGTYEQRGQDVRLAFFGGAVVYQGKINGNAMSGAATNIKDNRRWTWKVARKIAGAPAPAPVPVAPGGTGPGVGPPAAPQAPPAPAGGPPGNLPDYLKQVGFEPKVVRPDVGEPYCVLSLKDNDGWNYTVEVTAQKTGGMWLTCVLRQLPAPDRVPAGKLLQLLEANHVVGPCFFSYRAADSRLCLRLEVMGARPPAQSFRDDLSRLMNAARRSYDLWNGAAGGPAMPAPGGPSE